MANPEHVRIVEQGPGVVHKWRSTPAHDRLDLIGADLRHVNLRGADLRECHLRGTDLRGVELLDCDLRHADLRGADLRGARATRLAGANLAGADLRGADLRDADLRGAALGEARCAGADLTGADVTGAIFAGVVGLPAAKGLAAATADNPPPKHLDECVLSWPEAWLNWERLRRLGDSPCGAAACAVLLLLPLAWACAAPAAAPTDAPAAATVAFPVRLSWLLALGSLAMACGAGVYALRCPASVREHRQREWLHVLQRPLLHYLADGWSRRASRLACAACYAAGAGCWAVYAALALWSMGAAAWW